MSKLAKAFAQEPKKFTGQNNWLKLAIGSHQMRLCPRWNDDYIMIDGEKVYIPYRSAEQHPLYVLDDKKYMPQCFDFVFNNEELTKKAYVANKITKDDYDKWENTGCPLCVIANALIEMRDKKDKTSDTDYQRFLSKKTYYYNVVKRPENIVYMWSRSQKFFDEVKTALEGPYPDLFDEKKGHDFQLNASGEKLNREYSAPMFFPKPTPLGLKKGQKLFDLDDALIGGIRTYDEMVDIILQNHSTIVKRSGVDLNMFTKAAGKTKKSKKR